MHRFDVVLNYDPETSLNEVGEKDKRLKNFFGSLRAAIRETKRGESERFTETDLEFDQELGSTQAKIHKAFCDNINTRNVIGEIDEAIKKTHIYMESKGRKISLLEKAYGIIHWPLKVMGLSYELNVAETNEADIVDAIVGFRDNVRNNADQGFKKILEVCDKFRDYEMVDLNIRIEDKKMGEPSTWKHEDREVLIKEREKKIEDKLKKEREAQKKEEERLQKVRNGGCR